MIPPVRHGRGWLIDYCLQVLNIRDVSRLRLRPNDAAYLTLKKALNKLLVTLETDPRPQEQKRRWKIRDLVDKEDSFDLTRRIPWGRSLK
jgi:hypothetical protein